jgi:hypothetical protein
MASETFVTFKEAIAVFAKFPLNEGTVLGITQLAQIATGMVSNFIESFHTFTGILSTGEEGRHTGDHVVMVVMMVQV